MSIVLTLECLNDFNDQLCKDIISASFGQAADDTAVQLTFN